MIRVYPIGAQKSATKTNARLNFAGAAGIAGEDVF
jgi:hypothetical protein